MFWTSTQLYQVFQAKPDTCCFYCHDDLQQGGQVLRHTGEGEKHPGHVTCIQEWFKDGKPLFCPVCRVPVSFKSWKERNIEILKGPIGYAALLGAAAGIGCIVPLSDDPKAKLEAWRVFTVILIFSVASAVFMAFMKKMHEKSVNRHLAG